MLKILIGAVAAYLVIGLIISRKCFHNNGIGGTILTMVLWPAILVGSLFKGRCDKKSSMVILPGAQGAQGTQGPQGYQGPSTVS